MYDLEAMKKGDLEVVFKSGQEQFLTVLLFSSNPDYGDSEVLVEYLCDSDEPAFIRWSACRDDRDRDFFSHNCSFCGESQKECLMMDVCDFDSNPFEGSRQDVVFRDCGVTSVCRDCFEEIEGLVQTAARKNGFEFVAFSI